MQLSITGRHVEISPSLKSFAASKLEHLEDLFPRLKKAQIVLGVEKYRHTAEIHFRADHREYSAKKTTKDMYASLEGAVKAIAQQAHRRKDKLRSQHSRRSGAAKVRRQRADAEAEPVETLAPNRIQQRLPKIVRQRSAPLGPMGTTEAARTLSESEEGFLVYEDALSGRIHVMFRRQDGALGLIEA
jgi:putative sigma-54 modulation protein